MPVTPHITVLGASGFIGSAVLRELAAHPVRIRAVSRRPGPVPTTGPADIEVRSLDLTAPGAVRAAISGTDLVVHAVARIAGSATWRVGAGDTEAEQVTVGIARDLVDAAADHPLGVVYTGTTTQDDPAGEYDRQKLAAERLLLSADRAGVLTAVSIRLPTVFGYGSGIEPDEPVTARDRGVIAAMARRALAGQPLTMWHDGTVLRDLLHVSDAAGALTAAAGHLGPLRGRPWPVGSGVSTPLRTAFAVIARIAAEHTGVHVPVAAVEPPDHAEPGDFRDVIVDATAFRAVTGWRPRFGLEAALRHTITCCAREGAPAR